MIASPETGVGRPVPLFADAFRGVSLSSRRTNATFRACIRRMFHAGICRARRAAKIEYSYISCSETPGSWAADHVTANVTGVDPMVRSGNRQTIMFPCLPTFALL
jgi:hypothetical protein